MQLTLNTDYSLRVLLYVAERPDELISTKEISEFFQISNNHLVKVVNRLGKLGYLTLKRGRYGGGMSLSLKPEEINIGDVVKAVEPLDIVECFNSEKNTCRISTNCRLKGLLGKAKMAFLKELKNKTLSDML
ncbi:MAG: Rrf2 family transcriptional regulator [Lentisphaeraceae bacterium]|nr:Rrf2 family transcriptional regulator [Lentisphaeraceae bacterium]